MPYKKESMQDENAWPYVVYPQLVEKNLSLQSVEYRVVNDVCLKCGHTSMSRYIQDFLRMRSRMATHSSLFDGVQGFVMKALSLT